MTTYSSGHCGVADYVTGLQTRGDLESCLQVHLEQDGDQQPLLVALGVDVIGLKQITDTSGFLAGDKHLAAAVQHATTSDAQAQQEQEGQEQEAAAAAVVEFVGR